MVVFAAAVSWEDVGKLGVNLASIKGSVFGSGGRARRR